MGVQEFTLYGKTYRFNNRVVEMTYNIEKERLQDIYGWTDDQFDIYWNNPVRNNYADDQIQALRHTQGVLEQLTVNDI